MANDSKPTEQKPADPKAPAAAQTSSPPTAPPEAPPAPAKETKPEAPAKPSKAKAAAPASKLPMDGGRWQDFRPWQAFKNDRVS